MMDQASANETFDVIVCSLGRRCRWRARALGLSMSTAWRRGFAGAVGLVCLVAMAGMINVLITTVESGLVTLGR